MVDGPRDQRPPRSSDHSNGAPGLEPVAHQLDAALSVNAKVRGLILGYAITASMVAVLPATAWVYELKLLIVLLLNAYMIRGIGRQWAFPRGQGADTVAMTVLGGVSALAVTAMAFMTVFSVSLFVPVVRSWAEAAAYFALTLASGRVANDYFQGATRVDRERLGRQLSRSRGKSGAADDREGTRRRWNRRRLLLAGLGGSLAAEGVADYAHWRRHVAGASIDPDSFVDHLEAAYASEATWQAEMRAMRGVHDRVTIVPPRLPYDRQVARRMIFACRAAVMQFRTGMAASGYDGDVVGLRAILETHGESETMASFVAGARAFREFFGPGEQVATFVSDQEFFEDYLEVLNPPSDGVIRSPVQRFVRPIQDVLFDAVPKLVNRSSRRPVFSGFVLTTERANVIVFRGTQTTAEWLHNLRSRQRRFTSPRTGESFGWVHGGFLAMTERIRPSPSEIAARLDPSKPCYVTGHSLGAALATLCALKIAVANPPIVDRIRLYVFAGPRVGDPSFAERFSSLLPNTYRIVNLADSVPLVPASTMGRDFLHVGQEISFIAKYDDLLLNHVVNTYQEALERGVETPEVSPRLPVLTPPDRGEA